MARPRPFLSWGQLFCLFHVLRGGTPSLDDHVPVLLWSTHRYLQGIASTLHEGQVLSEHQLRTLLQRTPVSQDSRSLLVLFLQDTLCVDDFTRYSDASKDETPFRNVQASILFPGSYQSQNGMVLRSSDGKDDVILELLNSSSSSLVLPAVDHQAVSHLRDYFQDILNWTLANVDGVDTSQLFLVNASQPNLFVVKLQPVRRRINDHSTLKDLLENDKIIGRFAKALQQEGVQSTMIYTARQSSKVLVNFDVAHRSRRQLMSAEDQDKKQYSPLTFGNATSQCILFYATNFSLNINQNNVDLTDLTFATGLRRVDANSSECSATQAILVLNYTQPSNAFKSLEIRFVMTNKFYNGSARYWFTLDSLSIQHDGAEVAVFNSTTISAPAEYSFHCQLVGTNSQYGARLSSAQNPGKVEVFISEFQIQAFNVRGGYFSYASDCTSFFSPAIWMALVTSLILLLIFTYGIHMLVHLTTNSRFDDPKGPALSVPQTE